MKKLNQFLSLKENELVVPFLHSEERVIDLNVFDYDDYLRINVFQNPLYPKFRSKKINISSFVDFSLFSVVRINDCCFKYQNGELSFNGEASEKRKQIEEWLKNQTKILEKNQENFPFEYNKSNSSNKVFRMFNVGQGCCSAFYEDSVPTMIFDIGKSRKCGGAINLLKNEINDDKIHTFFISHYDSDHINMADLIPIRSTSNYRYFMPALLDYSLLSSPVVQQLFFKIINNKSEVVMFLNNRLTLPINYGDITIYQGNMNKVDPNQSTNENSHGLLCVLEKDDKTILIPGDMLYQDLFTSISQPIKPTHVIIPHHSCKYNGSLSKIDLSDLQESFIFCGPHGGYHHPNYTHFKNYLKAPVVKLVRKLPSKCFNDKSGVVDTFTRSLKCDHYDW